MYQQNRVSVVTKLKFRIAVSSRGPEIPGEDPVAPLRLRGFRRRCAESDGPISSVALRDLGKSERFRDARRKSSSFVVLDVVVRRPLTTIVGEDRERLRFRGSCETVWFCSRLPSPSARIAESDHRSSCLARNLAADRERERERELRGGCSRASRPNLFTPRPDGSPSGRILLGYSLARCLRMKFRLFCLDLFPDPQQNLQARTRHGQIPAVLGNSSRWCERIDWMVCAVAVKNSSDGLLGSLSLLVQIDPCQEVTEYLVYSF